ncbi:phosphomevalonate kinase [Knufia fluminis]|uniref:Phosphomevalonate kinase n=1 Tax=Knufia fluminis TaxID=191047 RepID=A0AAN8E7W8_9EURO|nr:phosphomevalonate kinase [Knufia fluminis]
MKGPFALSAPGKVLFTGGFLVLDRKHTGLVLGLDARIHVHIEEWEREAVNGEQSHTTSILVQSPQFQDAKWLYEVQEAAIEKSSFVQQITDQKSFTASSNKFVETTLRYVLSYLKARGVNSFTSSKLTIMADESYYSKSETTQAGYDGFTNFGCKLSEAHKTGLGSSAALVTSLTAVLIAWYMHDIGQHLPQHLIHNLAQAAHCAAQGKVGSGFDVAAAVFGACLYRRFTPAILEAVGEPASEGFAERLRLCVDDLNLDQKWDVEISSHAVQIPRQLLLLMCDVDCGSETPGMVRNILAWRKENPVEADLLWNAIQQGSNDLCQGLTRLAQLDGIEQDGFEEVADTLSTIRSLVREMSAKSHVPVEPEVITELLDSCTAIPGAVGGVAPGAGGYDAVALLVQNDARVVKELEARLDTWKAREAGTGVSIGKVRLLKARQAYEGVRYEDATRYANWS